MQRAHRGAEAPCLHCRFCRSATLPVRYLARRAWPGPRLGVVARTPPTAEGEISAAEEELGIRMMEGTLRLQLALVAAAEGPGAGALHSNTGHFYGS